MRHISLSILLVCFTAGVLPGCRSGSAAEREQAKVAEAVERRAAFMERARSANDRGVLALEAGDAERAVRLLSEAVDADPQFGDAQNNLGVAFLQLGRVYEAALRFEAASRLLPTSPDPVVNLGLLLEKAGKPEEAVARYREALRRAPEDPTATGNLARVKVRRGDQDDELIRLVERLQGDPRPGWRRWAREQDADARVDSEEPGKEGGVEPEPELVERESQADGSEAGSSPSR